MTIRELGSLGEFVSSVAVLITLVYLALQTRQNTRAVYAATELEMLREVNSMNRSLASDPVLSKTVGAFLNEPESVSDEEAAQAHYRFI